MIIFVADNKNNDDDDKINDRKNGCKNYDGKKLVNEKN